MSSPANVRSLDAIASVKAALVVFRDRVEHSLVALEGEMRRVLEWLEHDRPTYWKHQLRSAQDDVHQAHMDLQRCLMFPVADERPACREERDALRKAQARLTYCEEKTERLREWIRNLRHEITEYEGRIRKLESFTDVDLPQAVARLTKLLRRLEEYQALETPTGGPGPSAEQLAAELFASPGD